MTMLVDYLVRVDTSPEEARAFRRNPKKAMDAAGVSKRHQEALLRRDPTLIRKLIWEEKPLDVSLCLINRLFSPI
jgi:hypothetical protein